jgi:hypothetical protein
VRLRFAGCRFASRGDAWCESLRLACCRGLGSCQRLRESLSLGSLCCLCLPELVCAPLGLGPPLVVCALLVRGGFRCCLGGLARLPFAGGRRLGRRQGLRELACLGLS